MSSSPAMSPSGIPVADLLAHLPMRRREEAEKLISIMREISGEDPIMWAGKIIGFGEYTYSYDSGHSGTAPIAAFAPTPRHQTIYLVGGYQERYPRLVEALPLDPTAKRGGPKYSKACLYLPSLAAVDIDVLSELIERSVRVTRGLDRTE